MTTDAQAEQDQYAEAAAKKQWLALNPEPNTIEWYEKVSVEAEMDSTVATNPSYYRDLIAEYTTYEAERAAFDDDEAWLEQLRDEHGHTATDQA